MWPVAEKMWKTTTKEHEYSGTRKIEAITAVILSKWLEAQDGNSNLKNGA